MDLKSDSGAALPLVLVFSVFALIITALYIAAQFTIAKPALTAPVSFQALCTARSGVWKGMRLMSQPTPDTLARINTLDSMFNKKLFGTPTQAIKNDSSPALSPSDSPTVVSPFSADSDSFGTASLTLSYLPCFKVLTSRGTFRTIVKSVRAFFGGRLFATPDTVCYLVTPAAPEGGVIDGKIAHSPDSSRARGLRMKDLTGIVAYYRAQLREKTDSAMPTAPLTIQSSDQLKGLPEVINGPLLVNGVFGAIAWKEKRRIFVFGDIQFTGNTSVQDIEFVTTGEVRCYDDCRLHDVSVFCLDRFTVGDRAVFSGNALTLSTVLICKNARVEDRSVIVAYGENNANSPGTSKKKTPQMPVSVALSQTASVDGVVVACGVPGAIKTDKNVVVKGILWASGSIAHQGTLYGILRANDLAEMSVLMSATKAQSGVPALHPGNFLTGKIIRLPEVTEYSCPFFLGAIAVMRWEGG